VKLTPPAGRWKILLVEDNPPDARLLQEYLTEPGGEAYEVEHVEDLRSGLERLAAGGLDLLLLDLSLPDSHGLETFTRAHEGAPQLPIIVLSGLSDESVAIAALHEGAQDYLVKGQVDAHLLVRAMRYAIERKRAEEALAKERDLFHSLLTNLPDRIYFKDEQSRFIRISRTVAEQFRIRHPREAIGKTDFDFFAPEHAEAALTDERHIMESGQPMLNKIEKETLPDGSITWALTSKLPLRDRRGRTIGSFGISRDITKIKEMEDALEAERNLLRNLIDNLPDYIYVKDTGGRYVLSNPAFRRYLDVTSEADVKGKTVFDFFAPEVAARFNQDDERVLLSQAPLVDREDLVIDRQGRQMWHATTKVPLSNSEGNVIGLVGISRDITERKLAETRLQQANTELARKQSELQITVGELQQSHEDLKATQFQLIQAEKMQSVGRLAAGVAHEVKNPLAILKMGLEYFSRNLPANDSSATLVLDDMNEAIHRADSIILGLLDFSVPHALNQHPENLNSILEQSLALVRHEIEKSAHPIQVLCELSETLPPVYLDRNKMKQAFVNLLTNAIHAMPNGGQLILHSLSRPLQPGELDRDAGSRLAGRFRAGEPVAVVEIIDSGSGIAEDKLERVFDPFFTTKPTGKGTGLGLTVTKKILELHGAAIDICNRFEGGVRVKLIFKV
jgi:PAS domain S-box-containing protein